MEPGDRERNELLWKEAFGRCAKRLNLTRQQTRVVYARAFQHMSCTDIARRLSISVRTVKAHDRAARARLGFLDVCEMTERLHGLVVDEIMILLQVDPARKKRFRPE